MSDSGSMNLDLGVNLGVTLDGAGLQELSNTIKEISKGKDLQRYWKDVESATDSAAKAIERYNKNVNSKGLAENLLKQINALKALTKKENLSELFPNMELNLDELVESAKKIVPQINSQFSVDSFSQAFKTFDLLKEKSIDLTEAFRKLADYAELVDQNYRLRKENSQFRELIGDSDVSEVKSKLSEIKKLRDEAENIFESFLKVNNVERTDYWGDEKFSEYFNAIRDGSLTATEAIIRFKTEYAYLLEEGFKTNNDTFGLEQLQAFSNKLDSIFRQVEDTSSKINDIISNGVLTKSVENLSVDSSLTDSQRSLFGNLLKDEESLKSITTLFQKLIEESNKTKTNELFNSEQLQQVLSVFDRIENSLSSLRSIISDVGDGEEFSPLLKMINNVQSSISELATSVKGIGLNMNIDVGSDSEMEAKVQSKIANALQAYQRLFDHIKMSSAGGQIITDKFFDFDINQYDTMMGKLQAYKKFIDNMRKETKAQFNGQDVLYQDTYKSYWTQASAAMGQVTKAFNEMNAASGKNPLADMFGKTDLSEVISQLGLIVAKLEEISTTASSFKNVFANGFNVTASVEEIDKLTNRVKELEDELSKVKLNPVNVDKSNISSANSLSKMIKDWSEADKFLSSNGHKNSERFALFNAKTGYTSNQHLYDKADEISGELNLALIKQMEEAGQEITGAIHSHNDTNVASFSVEDLRVALNLLDRGITQHLVLAQNELMSLDMTKVNTNDFSKMVEKLEIAYEELNQELLNGLHGQANIIIEQAEKQIGGSIIKDTLSGSLDNALNKNGVFEKLPKELIDELYRIAKTASENIKYELGNDDGLSQIGKTFLSYFDFDSYLQDDSISSDTKKAIETLKNNINTATISEFDRLSNRLDFSGLVPEDVLQSEMQHLIKMAFKNMGLSDALKIQSVDDYIKENPTIKDVFQGGTTSAEKLEEEIKNIGSATEKASESAKEYKKILSQVGEFDIDSKVSAMYKRNDGQLESWTWRAKTDDEGKVLRDQDGRIEGYGDPTITVISKYEQLEKIIVKADNALRNLQKDLAEIKTYDPTASTTNIEAKIADQKEYIRLLEQTIKVISQSDEYLLDEQQIIDARNKAAREYALTTGAKQEKTDAKQSASDEKKRLANIEQVNRALNKQQIAIDAIEKTYNKTTNPDLDREVSNQQDLAELTQKKLDIQTKINSLQGKERNSANEKEFLELEKLIAEYKELAKYKLKSNNPSKQELGGQNLQTLIQEQIYKYDKLITKAEKYGEATSETVEKLKEQKDILSKIGSDGKYSATADQYYASRDTYKVESAALSAFEAETKAIEQETKAIERMNNELKSYNDQVPKKPAKRSDYFEGFVQNYINAIKEAQKYLDDLGDSPVTEEVKRKWKELTNVIEQAKKEMDAVPNSERGSDSLSRRKEIDTITKYLAKFTGISKQAKQELKGLVDQLQNDPSVNVKKIHDRFLELTTAERMAGREAKSFFDIFKSKTLHRFASQLAIYYFSFYDFIRYIRNAINTVKEFDEGLTKISYTMDMTKKQFDALGESISEMAINTGSSLQNALSVAQIYANMNTTAEEINKLSQPTIILSNLTGFDASTVADDIQAVTQQFNILAEDSMHIVDVYDYISRNIAVDYSKLWSLYWKQYNENKSKSVKTKLFYN